ncbi:hypothetical protein [Sulfolobus polyhedral virus 3]|nr:hypothetical protein [Sulfolobus polyhedral virus 3]
MFGILVLRLSFSFVLYYVTFNTTLMLTILLLPVLKFKLSPLIAITENS